MAVVAAPFPSRDAVAAELAMRRTWRGRAPGRCRRAPSRSRARGHLLMSCAGAFEAGDHALAAAHLADDNASLAAVSTASGIGRVAVHFTDAPGRDELRDLGLRLADLARSVRVRFSFRGVAANSLNEVHPWMLQITPGEAVAVNFVLQLHRLLADIADQAPIDAVLDCVASLQPKIFTVVEQEADHNKPGFLDRFTEALFYYSAVWLEGLDGAASSAQGT
ncbi:protein SLENDER RICE1-LIKE 1-like [Aegilops tauschii subsp. strangulata]